MGRVLGFIVIALVALLVSSDALGADHHFAFAAPPGWIDISPGTPDERLERVTPLVREAAVGVRAAKRTVFYAAAPGIDASMSVHLRDEIDTEPIDRDALARFERDLAQGGVFIRERSSIIAVDGLSWGRFEGRTSNGARFLVFLVPGRPRSALVLFTAPAESFDALLPAFEKAGRATRGAELPLPPKQRPGGPFGLLLVGALVVGVLLTMRLRRMRRSRSPAPSLRSGREQ